MRVIVALLLTVAFVATAAAQQPPKGQSPPAPNAEQPAPPPPDQPPPANTQAPPPPGTSIAPPAGRGPAARNPNSKAMMCRQQARAQGKRGQEMLDAVQMCNMQAREDCLRQAIDQKIQGQDRREFLKTCFRG